MARRWWKTMLLAVCAVLLVVWVCDRVQGIYWVGHTDLEIRFAVTDARTGAPIPGAQVEVQQSEGGFYEERDKREFVLVGDIGGYVSKVCRRSMCFGTRSGMGFTDTFVVHLPWWRYRVVAEGYETPEWAQLDVPEFVQQVQRDGPGKARLGVPAALHKKQS